MPGTTKNPHPPWRTRARLPSWCHHHLSLAKQEISIDSFVCSQRRNRRMLTDAFREQLLRLLQKSRFTVRLRVSLRRTDDDVFSSCIALCDIGGATQYVPFTAFMCCFVSTIA